MDFLSNELYATEMNCGTDFAYVLTDRITLSDTEYKVLQNQKDSFFIKCVKAKFNGRTQLYYMVKNYRTLEALLPKIDAASFYTIIGNILSNILEMKKNGFLSCQNVLISPDKIYVDPGTLSVFLVYLPIDRHIYEDMAEFETDLRTRLIRLLSDFDILMSPEIKALYENLADSTLSPADIYGKMSGTISIDTTKTGSRHSERGSEKSIEIRRQPMTATGRVRLLSLNMPIVEEIIITKPSFVIGKSRTGVDASISFNPMISRVHCKIIQQNGTNYLADVGSSNGTYLNGKRLPTNTYEQINNGDIIRLANTEFRVIVE